MFYSKQFSMWVLWFVKLPESICCSCSSKNLFKHVSQFHGIQARNCLQNCNMCTVAMWIHPLFSWVPAKSRLCRNYSKYINLAMVYDLFIDASTAKLCFIILLFMLSSCPGVVFFSSCGRVPQGLVLGLVLFNLFINALELDWVV